MADHGYYEELITARLDGELTAEESAALDAHLAVCPRCRAFRAAMEELSSLAEKDLAPPPPELKENVMAAVRAAAPAEKKKGKLLRFPARSIAVAAAAALVLWTGARLFAPKGSSMASMTAAAPQAAEEYMTAGTARGAEAPEAEEAKIYESFDAAVLPDEAPAEEAPAAPAPQPDAGPPEESASQARANAAASLGSAETYVIYDADGRALLTLTPEALPRDLLVPGEPCQPPPREADYLVRLTDASGRELTWLLWDVDGVITVLPPEGDPGRGMPAQSFYELLNGN